MNNSIIFYYYAKMMVEPEKLKLTPHTLRTLHLPHCHVEAADPSEKYQSVIRATESQMENIKSFYSKVNNPVQNLYEKQLIINNEKHILLTVMNEKVLTQMVYQHKHRKTKKTKMEENPNCLFH